MPRSPTGVAASSTAPAGWVPRHAPQYGRCSRALRGGSHAASWVTQAVLAARSSGARCSWGRAHSNRTALTCRPCVSASSPAEAIAPTQRCAARRGAPWRTLVRRRDHRVLRRVGRRARRTVALTVEMMRHAARGGTILGARGSRTTTPTASQIHQTFAQFGLEALIVVGGNGSLSVAHRLAVGKATDRQGTKTIDNDTSAPTNLRLRHRSADRHRRTTGCTPRPSPTSG